MDMQRRSGRNGQLDTMPRATACPRTDSPLGLPPEQRRQEGKEGRPVGYCLSVLLAPALQKHALTSWLVLQPVPLPAAKAQGLEAQVQIVWQEQECDIEKVTKESKY